MFYFQPLAGHMIHCGSYFSKALGQPATSKVAHDNLEPDVWPK